MRKIAVVFMANEQKRCHPVIRDGWSQGAEWERWLARPGEEFSYYGKKGMHTACLEWKQRWKKRHKVEQVLTTDTWQLWIDDATPDAEGIIKQPMLYTWKPRTVRNARKREACEMAE